MNYIETEVILNKLIALNDKQSLLEVKREAVAVGIVDMCKVFQEPYEDKLLKNNIKHQKLIDVLETEFNELKKTL